MMDKLVETVRLGMLNGTAMAQAVTSFLPRRPGLNHSSLNVGYVVGVVARRKVFSSNTSGFTSQ